MPNVPSLHLSDDRFKCSDNETNKQTNKTFPYQGIVLVRACSMGHVYFTLSNIDFQKVLHFGETKLSTKSWNHPVNIVFTHTCVQFTTRTQSVIRVSLHALLDLAHILAIFSLSFM